MTAYVAAVVGAISGAIITYGAVRFVSGRLALTAGRAWAYLFLIIGLGLSFAANIAAAFLVTDDPGRVTLAVAGAPPLVVFGMIEVVVRNPSMPRWLKWVSALFVAVPAAVVSYVHLVRLAMDGHHQTDGTTDWIAWAVALLTPLMIDGLLGACTGALLSQPGAAPVSTLHLLAGRIDALEGFEPVDLEPLQRALDAAVADLTARIEQVRAERTDSGNEGGRVRPPAGERKRYRTGEHPKYADWEAARMTLKPWGVAEMQAALGPDTTEAAAKSMLQRWETHYAEIERQREAASAARGDDEDATAETPEASTATVTPIAG